VKRSSGARRTKEYLVAGRIVRPHGVRGALILEPESDLMGRVGQGTVVFVGDASRQKTVAGLQIHGKRYLLSLKGVTSRESAEELRGLDLLLDAESLAPLPEGTYYRWQITGLRVLLEDDSELGSVVDVIDTGANDVYEIERSDGRKVLIPALSSVVLEIDLEGGILRVRPPAGLLDEG
jgi:16S rRNA processing protein RimM